MHELETLTAAALIGLVEAGTSTVVVPFGSIEHHGGHLPLGADALLADAVGREVAARLGAALAPTVRVGCSEPHVALMGTLTLSFATLTEVAIELAQSLARHGFGIVVLLSTHGGNSASLDAAVAHLDTSLDGTVACAPRGSVGPKPGAFSGEWLTSVILALRPELVEPANASRDVATEVKAADAERGRAHIERFVASIVQQVSIIAAPR